MGNLLLDYITKSLVSMLSYEPLYMQNLFRFTSMLACQLITSQLLRINNPPIYCMYSAR